MSQFKDLYVAADAAQAVYYQHGHHPEALRLWLVAEVRYLDAREIQLFKEPAVTPATAEQRTVYSYLASTLCDDRHRHFHGQKKAA